MNFVSMLADRFEQLYSTCLEGPGAIYCLEGSVWGKTKAHDLSSGKIPLEDILQPEYSDITLFALDPGGRAMATQIMNHDDTTMVSFRTARKMLALLGLRTIMVDAWDFGRPAPVEKDFGFLKTRHCCFSHSSSLAQ